MLSPSNSLDMFLFNIKVAFRRFYKDMLHNMLNVVGLGLGLATFMLIILWTRFELSHNDFFSEKEQIHRFYRSGISEGERWYGTSFPPAIGNALQKYYSEIKDYVRVEEWYGNHLKYEEQVIKIPLGLEVDSNFLKYFDFPLIQGIPESVLSGKQQIVLTESTAEKLFGSINPVGKTLTIAFEKEYVVSGIVEDPPQNSTLQFGYLVPFQAPRDSDVWGEWYMDLYLIIDPSQQLAEMEQRYVDFLVDVDPNYEEKDRAELLADGDQAGIIPIAQDHFIHQGKTKLYTFLLIGILILILAIINFVNLSTAFAGLRSKEVGVRKVYGGEPHSLRKQYLSESLIIACLSGFLSLAFVELIRPFFNEMMQVKLDLYSQGNANFWVYFLFSILFIGIVSGAYPAFFLSRLDAVKVLKGEMRSTKGKPYFRNTLVVFQFTIAIGLLIATAVSADQFFYLQNRETGLSGESTVHVEFQNTKESDKFELIQSEIQKIAGVKVVAGASRKPFEIYHSQSFKVEEDMNREEGDFNPSIWVIDPNLLSLYELELVRGRNFDKQLSSDQRSCVINERFAKKRGWTVEEAIGKKVYRWAMYENEFTIIGVLKDFNFNSLRETVSDLILVRPEKGVYQYSFAVVKIDQKSFKTTLGQMEQKWETIFPNSAFDVTFMDQTLATLYYSNQVQYYLFLSFSVVAVMIALLGLFSLSAFSAQRRTKEMGVRKVYGAGAFDLLKMMMIEFTRFIILSSCIAVPIVYYFISDWLESFAYHVDFNFWFIPMAIGLGLLTSWLTVFYHSMKVVRQDPVKALRYE